MPTNDERREYRYGYDPRGRRNIEPQEQAPAESPSSAAGGTYRRQDLYQRPAPPARRGYDPARNQALQANTSSGLANRWGGVWDSVRSEMNALAASPPGRLVGEAAKQLPAVGRHYMNTWERSLEGMADMHSDQDTRPDVNREKRIAQAGLAPEQPVMATSARDPKDQSRATAGIMADPKPQDGGLGAGPGGKPPLSEPSTKSKASGSVATRGGSIQLSPSDQEYLNRPAVNVDPRKRYYDMAGMSLEQRNAMLDAMPEGQRPIHTIRGNREGWYNPALSREFSGISEALTGVEGRPTYKSESAREEEALDRGMAARIAEGRNRTHLAGVAMSQAGEDRRASIKGSQGEKWTLGRRPTADGGEEGVILDEKSGKVLPVRTDTAQDVAAFYRNLPKKQWGMAAQFLSGHDREARNEVFKYLPEDMRAELIRVFEGEAAKSKKKE